MSKLGTYANKLYLINEKIRRGCCCGDPNYDPGACCGGECEWFSSSLRWNIDFCGSCDGPMSILRTVRGLGTPDEDNIVYTSPFPLPEPVSDVSPFGGGDVGGPPGFPGFPGFPCNTVGDAIEKIDDGTTRFRWTVIDYSSVLLPIFLISFVNEIGEDELVLSEVCTSINGVNFGDADATLVGYAFELYRSANDTAYVFSLGGTISLGVDVEPETGLPFSGPWLFNTNSDQGIWGFRLRVYRNWRARGGLVSPDLRCPDLAGSGLSPNFVYEWKTFLSSVFGPFSLPLTVPQDDEGWIESPDQPNGDTTISPITSWQPTWRRITDDDCTQTCIYGLA